MSNEPGVERGEEKRERKGGVEELSGFQSTVRTEGIEQAEGGREVLDIWKKLESMLLPC